MRLKQFIETSSWISLQFGWRQGLDQNKVKILCELNLNKYLEWDIVDNAVFYFYDNIMNYNAIVILRKTGKSG